MKTNKTELIKNWEQKWHEFEDECNKKGIDFNFALRDNYGETTMVDVIYAYKEEYNGEYYKHPTLTDGYNVNIKVDPKKSPIENLKRFWDAQIDEYGNRDMFCIHEPDWDLDWKHDLNNYKEYMENARWAMKTLNIYCTDENYEETYKKLTDYAKNYKRKCDTECETPKTKNEKELDKYIKKLNTKGENLSWRHNYDDGEDGPNTHTIMVIDWYLDCDTVAEADTAKETLKILKERYKQAG